MVGLDSMGPTVGHDSMGSMAGVVMPAWQYGPKVGHGSMGEGVMPVFAQWWGSDDSTGDMQL